MEITTDWDGDPRFVGGDDDSFADVDMGAYEFQGGVSCPADLDGNGTAGAFDLAQLLGSWGPYEPCPPFGLADFNEDCAVNAADLAQLLGAWGPCPQVQCQPDVAIHDLN
ncbi:MAG: hypothetical protein IID41_12705 [Planctomycetes bacterium]|nr:hypothetical protein [Planctomycetota bacterium]